MIVNPANVPDNLRAIRFGVEIEMLGATVSSRRDLADAIASVLGTTMQAYSFDSFKIDDPRGGSWNLKSDGSLRGDASHRYGTELVTPPLTYARLETLDAILVRARALGFIVNATCGLHVHVDANGTNVGQMATLVRSFCDVQASLFEKLEPTRTGNRYCRKVQANALRPLCDAAIVNAERALRPASHFVEGHGMPTAWHDRYRALNVTGAFLRHGTVEFRLWSGSLEFEAIRARVLIALSLRAIAETPSTARRTLAGLLVAAGLTPNADTALAFVLTEAVRIAGTTAARATTARRAVSTTDDVRAAVRAYRAGDRSAETMAGVRAYRANLAARRAEAA